MDSDLQQAGEVCESCRERWEGKSLDGRVLRDLPEVTLVYHQKVAVCVYCDGPCFDIATKNSVPKKKKK